MPLGITETQLRGPLKPPEHHCDIVLRGLRGAFNCWKAPLPRKKVPERREPLRHKLMEYKIIEFTHLRKSIVLKTECLSVMLEGIDT